MTLPKAIIAILDGIPRKELEEYMDHRKGAAVLKRED